MTQKLPITAIVMTLNESRNLEACLASVHEHVAQILIVDSFSGDDTLHIARRYTQDIVQNKWVSYAAQYRWAVERPEITQPWLLRLDADERWTPEGFRELRAIMEREPDVNGIYVKMKIFFMGRWIKHGGFYPNYFLRVYRRDKGRLENRWMDEHIQVDGRTFTSTIDVIEANYDRQSNLSLFTQKHNGYSTREAVDLLLLRARPAGDTNLGQNWRSKTERKRWLKEHIYARAPLFLRPTAYFFYRYLLQAGFLDGPEGFVFHSLQALWYRFLVDAKIYQIEKLAAQEGRPIEAIIEEHFGIDVKQAAKPG
jgi:glycosyltransferase involved in cell wall biosynthesis